MKFDVLQTNLVKRVPLEQRQQYVLTVMREELLQASCGLVHWQR